jgi:hypothetical protein
MQRRPDLLGTPRIEDHASSLRVASGYLDGKRGVEPAERLAIAIRPGLDEHGRTTGSHGGKDMLRTRQRRCQPPEYGGGERNAYEHATLHPVVPLEK